MTPPTETQTVETEPKPPPKPGRNFQAEAEEAYRQITGSTKKHPGINQLLNCAQASCAYSGANEDSQIRRMKAAGASKGELAVTRRVFVVRRRMGHRIWRYLSRASLGVTVGAATQSYDQLMARKAQEEYQKLSPEEKERIWRGL